MTAAPGQRGALLLGAIALIVVVSVLVVAMASLSTTNARSGSEYLGAAQAFYVAEAGLEKGIREWGLNPAYAGEVGTAFGPGTFDIQPVGTDFDNVTPLPGGQRRIISTGRVGTAARSVEVIVGATGGNLLVNADFNAGPAPPAGPDNWAITADPADPTNGYDGVGGVGGSAAVTVRKAVGGKQILTLVDQVLATPVTTTAPTVLIINFEYKILNKGTVEFEIFDSLGGSYKTVKINGNDTGGTWIPDVGTFNVPAGVTITAFRISLEAKGNPVRQAWVDNLVLRDGSGPGVNRLAWRENFH